MGLLSTTASVARYRVDGQLDAPIVKTVAEGLKKNTIADIDNNPSDHAAGWTCFEDPFNPRFESGDFMYGTYMVFSLRVDKKTIPNKLVKKYYTRESDKRLKALDRNFLSNDEKKAIKDHVINMLNLKVPATPNIYDVVWLYEQSDLWFFSNLKSANEHLETLFFKSFHLNLIRKIPYTMAIYDDLLSDTERDVLNKLSANENPK